MLTIINQGEINEAMLFLIILFGQTQKKWPSEIQMTIFENS